MLTFDFSRATEAPRSFTFQPEGDALSRGGESISAAPGSNHLTLVGGCLYNSP
jgi:hypothetical protein